jgi:hypothetical protein
MVCQICHSISPWLPGQWWLLKADAYSEMKAKVIWNGKFDRPFPLLQGTRQGGIASTSDFKAYIHDLLALLSENTHGTSLGSTYLGVLACADDLILIADTCEQLHEQVLLTTFFANQERFQIHPEKSTIGIFGITASEFDHIAQIKPWKVNQHHLSISQEFTHLGVDYNLAKPSGTATATVDTRLRVGRNTLYALLGAGLHGVNGINPMVSHHIYQIYVVPRILYSLEMINLTTPILNKLETAHRTFLKQIQSLPTRTANPALYILLGALPLEAHIDQRLLTSIPALSDNPTIFHALARQIAMKDRGAGSWTRKAQHLLNKYDLPQLLEILEGETSKLQWKNQVKMAIHKF